MNSNVNGVTVILCCYNSVNRIEQTLKHLAFQKGLKDNVWEVVLVDNNSTDTTVNFAKKLWQSFYTNVDLIIVKELNPGLSFARKKGMEVAKYNLFLFCDDDNWLCDIYVQTAFEIMECNTEIGALGGWCEAAFETEKPVWFDAYARFFAVSKQGEESGDITNKKGCLYGAGMVIRKSHWVELNERGFENVLSDRKGNNLNSGGDTEYSYALRLLGSKIWFDERLYFKHFMTKERLHLDYVSRLRKAMTYSNFVLWAYLDSLEGKNKTAFDFFNQAFKGFPKHHLKTLRLLFVGDFEQKEQAKLFFREWYYLVFFYQTYKTTKAYIDNWLNASKKKG